MAQILHVVVLIILFISHISCRETGRDAPHRIHTLFSVECHNYFDWQTVGLMNSFRKSGQPGLITRLLSCTEDELKNYKGMHLAPTLVVPSMTKHPVTGDVYPAINKPAGVLHWIRHSQEAKNADWVVILDADMIIRGPIIPWELGADRGRPFAAYYGYLVGCDNILAQLHTKHPERCDKVGGLLAMHIDDLRSLAPLWLSKTEEVRADKDHWATNITGDIYGTGWISEMYGYTFGAAEIELQHIINQEIMIYPGYTPLRGVEPVLLHYGLSFTVGNWTFGKSKHRQDAIVYECGRLFDAPPYPREVEAMQADEDTKRGFFLSIECVNTINEGLMKQHAADGCQKPKWSKYESFLKSKSFAKLTQPKYYQPLKQVIAPPKNLPKIHTVFSTECNTYFDWQTVGFMHSFRKSGQPGGVTRLLSCTDENLKNYLGRDLAPTHYVPSMSRHPLTNDWYPAINKPAAVLHWLNHATIDAEFIVILDADMILRGPITPWEFNASLGHPVSTPYEYLIGCDNILAELHTRHPRGCEKVGGVIIMHIEDLRQFALLWLHKTEEVRADKSHYARNISGDVYSSGWISEMYGYSFGAAEMGLRHNIVKEILIYPGYPPAPGVKYRVLHYGLTFRVGNWSFHKANWWNVEVVNKCWSKFPEPPDMSKLIYANRKEVERDLLSVECIDTLNEALFLHHKRRNCPDPNSPLAKTMDPRKDDEVVEQTKSTGNVNERQDRMFGSLKFWIVALWVISGFGFAVSMTKACWRSRGRGRSSKSVKNKKKTAFFDTTS